MKNVSTADTQCITNTAPTQARRFQRLNLPGTLGCPPSLQAVSRVPPVNVLYSGICVVTTKVSPKEHLISFSSKCLHRISHIDRYKGRIGVAPASILGMLSTPVIPTERLPLQSSMVWYMLWPLMLHVAIVIIIRKYFQWMQMNAWIKDQLLSFVERVFPSQGSKMRPIRVSWIG